MATVTRPCKLRGVESELLTGPPFTYFYHGVETTIEVDTVKILPEYDCSSYTYSL